MGDRFTAAELAQLASGDVTRFESFSVTIETDSLGAATDITDRVLSRGKLKTRLCNKHPRDQGSLLVPVFTLVCDNTDGYFNAASSDGPYQVDDDEKNAIIVLTMKLTTSVITVEDFTGDVDRPTRNDDGTVSLEVFHPYQRAARRVWQREDRLEQQASTTFAVDLD
jgi:hypothetical protein